jgi:uncharacterized membrane protein
MKPESRALPHRNDGSDDSMIDTRIAILLRTGMLASAAVILSGGVLFLVRHGLSMVDYSVFRGTPEGLNRLSRIASGAMHGDGLAIIQSGLVMLIATPVARVAFSVVAFLGERDYRYVIISSVVLGVLLCSLIWH